ncbi:MAG: hypothetical protein ACKVS6_04490 [Planctomycetota bacterium]
MMRLALSLLLTIPLFSLRVDDAKTAETLPAKTVESSPAMSLPSSRPLDARIAEIHKKIESLKAFEAQLASGSMIVGFDLEKQFDLPPFGADSHTQKLRGEITQLEEKWLAIRTERDKSLSLLTAHNANVKNKSETVEPPKPHPQAEPDPIRLAIVYIKKREYQRVIDTLSTVTGPDARFLEACAYDALDVVDMAQDLFKKSLSEGSKDPRLVASAQRASKFVEWRIQFGRPEDLTAPLRRGEVADVIQSAVNSARDISSGSLNTTETPAGDVK